MAVLEGGPCNFLEGITKKLDTEISFISKCMLATAGQTARPNWLKFFYVKANFQRESEKNTIFNMRKNLHYF